MGWLSLFIYDTPEHNTVYLGPTVLGLQKALFSKKYDKSHF